MPYWDERTKIDIFDQSSQGNTWSAGVFLSFPFFDGLKTRVQVAQAKSDLETNRLTEVQLRNGIALEARVAVDALRESTEIVEALKRTVSQAERLYFLSEKGYELGVKTQIEVRDAQLNLVLAQGNLARARRDYLVALANLDWVRGTLGEVAS